LNSKENEKKTPSPGQNTNIGILIEQILNFYFLVNILKTNTSILKAKVAEKNKKKQVDLFNYIIMASVEIFREG
jgi:hypothetical protein